ncbi:hypothetical protein PIB30_041678 [Stylosanthes scabra]|uniref:Aminotransferase-like plant mobile domain-containing protein n=1 Tax=Stylosanthes scabra TaxID=79078 RepID=A0ABU6TFY6_9FABA|nr:hypothetical protein [Stylosanthes scabra]
MGRTKTTSKRARRDEVAMEGPPQNHPMDKFFTNKVDFNNYIINFGPRREITPRYLDMNLLTSQNFNNLSRILVDQDLVEFVKIREKFYPDLVGIANSSLIVEFDEIVKTSFTMKFSLGTHNYEVNVGTFCELSGLNWHGTLFKSGDKPPEAWNFDKNEACQFFNLDPNCGRKMPTKPMSDEHRLLHYLLVWVILPRSNNHGIVMHDDLVIMRALYSGVKLNWSYFIAHRMGKLKDGPTIAGLGYMFLWTRIFKHFNIDLSIAKEQRPQQVEEEHQGQDQEHIGSFHNAPQPSMLDLMQELQRINTNMTTSFARIDRRFQRYDTQVKGIYEHLGLPLPPQEDEDED